MHKVKVALLGPPFNFYIFGTMKRYISELFLLLDSQFLKYSQS